MKFNISTDVLSGSTINTLLHDRINPKDCQVLSLGDSGFLQFFRVVSRDYGKPHLFVQNLSSNIFFDLNRVDFSTHGRNWIRYRPIPRFRVDLAAEIRFDPFSERLQNRLVILVETISDIFCFKQKLMF